MILEEITLGKTENSKREAIQKNLGEQVILNDCHEKWCHGVLLKKGYNNGVYRIKVADGRGQRELFYNDLNKLLVLNNHPRYSKPEIK